MQDNPPIKRKRKTTKCPIKFKIELNEEQKDVKNSIYNNEIVVINAKAGSGKTSTVVQTALEMLFLKEVDKLYVTRPTVETGKTLGYLPGNMDEKINPYIEPIKQAMFDCYDKEKVEKHLENKDVIAEPIQFMRGRNFGAGSLLFVDEVQNCSVAEIYLILTRLAKGGRIVLCGDIAQQDTKEPYTGLHYLIDMAKKIDGVKLHTLKTNHRSDIVQEIIDYEYSRRKTNN